LATATHSRTELKEEKNKVHRRKRKNEKIRDNKKTIFF
jgi:hypothetical protein